MGWEQKRGLLRVWAGLSRGTGWSGDPVALGSGRLTLLARLAGPGSKQRL